MDVLDVVGEAKLRKRQNKMLKGVTDQNITVM